MTEPAFAALLHALDPGGSPAAAGERYQSLHRRLTMFFAARHCEAASADLADTAIDRLARRVAEGAPLSVSIESYALGIARNVAREQWKKPAPADVNWNGVAAPPVTAPEGDGHALRCLDECLAALPASLRDSLLRFYVDSGAAKIENRQRLAAELGLDANALRVRMHRARVKLEACVSRCLGNDSPGRTI
ncbi:MAG: sigma-70 family RNA polymerase sigma factor [Bryobacterales bacterium]|nr:sigma-70 family RNA polymerase sigma factor [Bryobacterales bacterium]